MNQEETTKKELVISEGKKSSTNENDSLNIFTSKVKENVPRITIKQAILANLIVGPIALAVYFPLELRDFRIMGDEYFFHALLSFICFAIIPCIYLAIFRIKTGKGFLFFMATKNGLRPKNIISSLLQGLAMHAGIFFPWVVLSQKYIDNVYPLYYFLGNSQEWFWWIFFVSLNVIMFEFYSKAFVQIQFSEIQNEFTILGRKITLKDGRFLGFMLQFVVWMFGHIQELRWLPTYIGPINAVFFIIVSGVLTGWTVYKTENIFGVTLGHIMLNVFIAITFNL
ncbi:MAG: CPBP family glutamic-type intramembrane protease [Candidatus Heimdallarchaeota archaeon]